MPPKKGTTKLMVGAKSGLLVHYEGQKHPLGCKGVQNTNMLIVDLSYTVEQSSQIYESKT